MLNNNSIIHFLVSRVIDFVVLGCTFYFSCALLSQSMDAELTYQALIYASVIVVAIRFGRGLLAVTLKSLKGIAGQVAGNALGLGLGALILSVLSIVYPQMVGTGAAILVSSIIAFFILGTISPLFVKQDPTSAR